MGKDNEEQIRVPNADELADVVKALIATSVVVGAFYNGLINEGVPHRSAAIIAGHYTSASISGERPEG